MASKNAENSISINLDILEEAYIPADILVREPQLKELQSCILPAHNNSRPINAWLYGKPGTGKTMIAKYLLEKLKKESRIGAIYINCWKSNSFFAVLDTMLNELRIGFGEERDTRLKLYKFETFVENKPFIIVLDEIDLMTKGERNLMIYNLLSVRKVGLICISESRSPFFDLEDRIKSRLNAKFIYFDLYTTDELTQILKERALAALKVNSWNESILKKIADLTTGDARTAVQTLKNAAQFAEASHGKTIRIDHIKKAISNIKDLRKVYKLKKLSEDQWMLYDIIKKHDPVLSPQLWKLYLKECHKREIKPIARRTFSHYMDKFKQLNLIKVERARVKGRIYAYSALD